MMPIQDRNNERRSNGRLATELDAVIYYVAAGEERSNHAKVREISELGLSFTLTESIELPEKIRVEIKSEAQKLRIPAKVSWRAKANTLYGVAFGTLSEAIFGSLATMLEEIENVPNSRDRRMEDRRTEVEDQWNELESHRTLVSQLRSKLKHRVAVTGIGAICPLGNDLEVIWRKLVSGETGIAKPTGLDFECNWPGFALGQVPSFDPIKYIGAKKSKRMNRHAQMACSAALLAAEDSGLKTSNSESYRVGVYLGTSIGGMDSILAQHKVFLSRGVEKVQPFEWLGGSVGDSTAEISLLLKLRGPCHTICTGSASSADAIGHAFRAVQSGDLDAVIVGGAEAPLFLEMLSLFRRTGVLAADEAFPEEGMKPFDARRNGFVLGEGAAFLVLENMERATKRNAKIRGEVVGYGSSCDAHHAFASDPLGRGMAWAIQSAMRDSGLAGSALDYVNMHGTGTLLGDLSETRAIKKAFGKNAYNIALSSTKPFTGHLLGAAGAVEAIFTFLSMQYGSIPPTLNLKQQDPSCDLNFTPLLSKKQQIRTALSINSGFGGKNSAIVLTSATCS